MEHIKALTEVLMLKLTQQDRYHLRHIKKKSLSDLPKELQEMKLADVLIAIDNTKVLGGKSFKKP